MDNQDSPVFGEKSASLSNDELEMLIGQGDWSTTDMMRELRDLKTRMFTSDANKDGILTGDEIKAAGLEKYVKEGNTREHS